MTLADPAPTQRRLGLRAGGVRVSVDMADVVEVVRAPSLTAVPMAPDALAGLGGLRGAVIPVVSLARLMGEPGSAVGNRLVVLRRTDPLALSVDAVDPGDGAETEALDIDALLGRAFAAARAVGPKVRAAPAVERAAEEAHPERSLLVFQVSGQAYALPLTSVKEVFRAPDAVLRLADADDVALGVIEHRGGAVPLIAPEGMLGLPASGGARARVILISLAGAPAGLLVDEVSALARIDEREVRPAPAVLNRGAGEAVIEAIARTNDGLVALLSTDRLIRHQAVAEAMAEAPVEIAQMETVETVATEKLVLFQLGDETYGLPVASVLEVLNLPETLAAPPKKAASSIAGLMNRRGQPMVLVDFRDRLAITGRPEGRRRVLVLETGGVPWGLAIDGVDRLIEVEASRIAEMTPLAQSAARIFHRTAMIEIDGRPVLVADPEGLLDETTSASVREVHGKSAAKA